MRPSRNRVRTRLAVGLTLSTVAITLLVGVVTASLAVWRADDPHAEPKAAVARVNGTTVLVVADATDPHAAGDARHDALGWMLVALGVAIVPSIAVAWAVSSRLMGKVDTALAEVDERDRERRRRLDEVIHELRTPLAVAGTNLELAASDPTIDPDTGTLIDAARRANERMRRTVDDLAEHGKLSVSTKDGLDLAAEVRAVVAEHAGPARARSIHLRSAGSHRLPLPQGDRAAVRTTLGNLTSNAVRLAPGGSTITISAGEHGDWAWAAVTDEGPGIPAKHHAHVFARGWRGRHDRDRDRSPDRGGHQRGLGLTISRQLTEAHGGLLTIDSDEGHGTTFTVWLPMSPTAIDRDVVADDRLHPAARPWVLAGELEPVLA
jgi:signal transduction histidine kinase